MGRFLDSSFCCRFLEVSLCCRYPIARAIREIRVEVSDSDFERLSFGFLDLIIGFTECDETRIDRGSAHLISELRGHQAEKTELKNWAQQYVEDLELFRSQRGFDEMIRVGRQSPRS